MKNIYTCIVICLFIISTSCNKETGVTSAVLQSSSSNLNELAAKHYIGEHFGGGIIFYLDKSGTHGLIAAFADFEEPAFWSQKDTLNGAKDTALGSGLINTQRIVKAQGYPVFEADNYVALECLELILNGYQDWYLPSLNELNALYQNRKVIGGFQRYSYWSSSEAGKAKAWLINFNDGSQILQVKTARYAFRPVRKF